MNKIKARILSIGASVTAFLIPMITRAQLLEGGFDGTLEGIEDIINEALIPVISALALVAFFYGLAKYVFQADDDEAKDQGKKIMIAGIIALFLMAAIGGIINFLVESTVGGDGGDTFNVTNPVDYNENN